MEVGLSASGWICWYVYLCQFCIYTFWDLLNRIGLKTSLLNDRVTMNAINSILHKEERSEITMLVLTD